MKNRERQGEKRERPIFIEVASIADAEGIGHVHGETWLATYPNEKFGITREDIEAKVDSRRSTRTDHWRKTIEEKTGEKRVLVAKDESQTVIGFCLGVKTEGENKIQAIYVLPGQHGKDIGQKLITETLRWFGSDKPISLNVAKYNVGAIQFYKKMGFVEVEEVPPSPAAMLPSGKIIPKIRMVKAIQSEPA